MVKPARKVVKAKPAAPKTTAKTPQKTVVVKPVRKVVKAKPAAPKTTAKPATIKVGSSRKGNVNVPYDKKKTTRTASNPKDFLTYNKKTIAAERKRIEDFLADAKAKYAGKLLLNLYNCPKKDREEYIKIYSNQKYTKEELLRQVKETNIENDKYAAKDYNSGLTQKVNSIMRQYCIALAQLDIIEQKVTVKKTRPKVAEAAPKRQAAEEPKKPEIDWKALDELWEALQAKAQFFIKQGSTTKIKLNNAVKKNLADNNSAWKQAVRRMKREYEAGENPKNFTEYNATIKRLTNWAKTDDINVDGLALNLSQITYLYEVFNRTLPK